ncbi:hypothetical protein ElyMa_005596700 [Elysia marginata]|uniref:Uncharacterized protein n=1 Tax=Elysia marginata TaxID=1093978 RepID=A0AAV4F3Y3_9GAST|nr:hypothetical protein ElyMa_005596700 [Elysia marginata]
MATEVFGPRGDEKSGCRQEWLAYCDTKEIISKFTSFRGNRFNNVFENAEAVIHHKQHIKDFLSNYATSKNKKLSSIEKDIDNINLVSIVGAIALFSSLFTTPYWLLMNSSQSYGSFPPYVKALDEVLLMWEKANHFHQVKYPELFQQFYKPSASSNAFVKSPECQTDMALKSFKEICSRTSVVLKRQLSDFLGEGLFANDIPDEIKAILDTCPLTNLSGERLFGGLDYHMKKTPHSSTHHRSTINMWKHNRVASWLKKKNKSEKTRILADALKNRKCLRQKHKTSELLVREKLKEKLKANEFQKVEKELKLSNFKSITLDKVQCTCKWWAVSNQRGIGSIFQRRIG